jgi:undecaprenyl-diphosphatase
MPTSASRGRASLDYDVFRAINDFASGHDWFEDWLRFFAQDAQYLFAALLAALFIARGKWQSRNARHGVVAAGIAAALGLAIAHGITLLWDRPRPFESHSGVHLFVAPSGDPSFPSDHATGAFAIAVSLYLRSRRVGLIALAMAAVVALARVAVGVHYPADVIGGALVGTTAALLLWIEPLRGWLSRLADLAGSLYERAAVRPLRACGWGAH